MDAGKFEKQLLSLSQNELCGDCLAIVLRELDDAPKIGVVGRWESVPFKQSFGQYFGEFREYKGYIGSIEYSPEDAIYYGELLGIKDMVLYEGEDIQTLYKDYIEAIDDYIEFKEEIALKQN